MAIRLHIQENRVRLKVGEGSTLRLKASEGNTLRLKASEGSTLRLKASEGNTLRLKASEGVPVYPPTYTGQTEVIPTTEEQVLLTGGLYVADHIKVKPIPNNYGLITYNGSIITVS